MDLLTPSFFSGICVGLALLLFQIIRRSFFSVEEGHVAVLENFGRVLTDSSDKNKLKTFMAGIHFKYPWQDFKIVSLMDQFWDLETDTEGKTTMTLDGTALQIKSALRFRINPNDIYHYLFGVARPAEHLKGLFVCLLKQEIARFKDDNLEVELESSYAHIRQERGVLHQHILNFFGEKITNKYGIQFDAIDLVDIFPPEELAQALNAVLNAKAETEAQFARAQAECSNRLMAAEEGVIIAGDHAQAAQIEILTMAEKLKELERDGTLDLYIDRRKSEIINDSKNVYLRK